MQLSAAWWNTFWRHGSALTRIYLRTARVCLAAAYAASTEQSRGSSSRQRRRSRSSRRWRRSRSWSCSWRQLSHTTWHATVPPQALTVTLSPRTLCGANHHLCLGLCNIYRMIYVIRIRVRILCQIVFLVFFVVVTRST